MMKLLGALLMLAMIGACFVPLEFPVDTEFWRTCMDVSHLPLFALFTFCVYPFVADRDWPHAKKCRTAFGVAAAVSIGVEWTQPLVGRSQSVVDQVYGLAGAGLALAWLWLWPRRKEGQVMLVLTALTLVAGALTAGPVWRKDRVRRLRAALFPVLGEFERVEETQLWRPNYYSYTGEGHYDLVDSFVSQGKFALEVDASVGGWPGVDYDAGDADWSGYDYLALDLYNPASEFILRLRIDDDGDCSAYDLRFNLETLMEPGWNRLVIPTRDIRNGPAERQLNLRAIRRLVLFISDADAPRKFFLDNVRLTNRKPE